VPTEPAPSKSAALSGYTTLRLGGPAARLIAAATAEELVGTVQAADAAGDALLVLGGGSNLVIADEGFCGTVVRVATAGVSARHEAAGQRGNRVLVTAAAGENWDRLVQWAVAEKLAGIECLAGIPGLAGATPIQNVGAYGQEVAEVITAVRVLDRDSGTSAVLTGAQCGFGYRASVFKRARWGGAASGARSAGEGAGQAERTAATGAAAGTGRYVVLDVTFALRQDSLSGGLRYAELAAKLGIAAGAQAPLDEVRAAVLDLRRGKGMVLDPADPDTASAGSFFTNPVLTPAEFADLERIVARRQPGTMVPRFAADGGVKVPAAWLIEQAGFGKGYPGAGAVRISAKHTLALTNRGGATTAELIGLARRIVAGVESAFGIRLANEPMLVGVAL